MKVEDLEEGEWEVSARATIFDQTIEFTSESLINAIIMHCEPCPIHERSVCFSNGYSGLESGDASLSSGNHIHVFYLYLIDTTGI